MAKPIQWTIKREESEFVAESIVLVEKSVYLKAINALKEILTSGPDCAEDIARDVLSELEEEVPKSYLENLRNED